MVARKLELLAIVGPTASGKTDLAIEVAKALNGEIIAADSRTIYKDLNIGTAKPTQEEQLQIPHHGLDLITPDQSYSAADFKEFATIKIRDIQSRSKLPILVGGTGLYIDSVLYDFTFVEPNDELRKKYTNFGTLELQERIIKNGLEIPRNSTNKRHLIAALERGGKVGARKPLPKNTIVIGINPGKEALNLRISSRAKKMFKDGVVNETNAVVKKYGWDIPGLTGGIYRVIYNYGDKLDIEKARNEFVLSDLRLAKRQLTWFKRNKDIVWFESSEAAYSWINDRFTGTLKK